jgi:hypothetical protein
MDTNHPLLNSLEEILKKTLKKTVMGPIQDNFSFEKLHRHK